MSGKIPQEFIDELLARVDIVDVIESRIPLRKAGAEYQALCPFHGEKTPSFTVSPSKQFFHCFGCGAHGSAIGFLMDYEHMEFPDAVEELAGRVGLEVPRTARRETTDQHGALYEAMAAAAAWYRRQLREHPASRRAIDYLKGRGLTGEIVQQFGIGFAPPGWDGLLAHLGGGAQGRERLIQAGLVIDKGEGRAYDRFRDRIVFPIRDRRGRVIAFGGRVLGDGEPKYLNSPETPIFHKGRELYGLYEARTANRRLERLLVVEGYMDVVALAQHGVGYAVATLGTATTADHLERLFRTVPEVVFCFDGDRAGRAAAWRALEGALPVVKEGREARFLFLPEGEDPDSLVRREGSEAFERRVREDAVAFSEFFFSELQGAVDTGSVDGRARLVERARPLLARLPEGVFRDMMIERLAELARLAPDRVAGAVREAGSGRSSDTREPPDERRPRRTSPRGGSRRPWSPLRWALTILVQHPELGAEAPAPQTVADSRREGIDLLCQILEMAQASPNLNSGTLLERWRGDPREPHLIRLAAERLHVDQDQLRAELLGAMERLRQEIVETRYDELLAKHQREGLDSEEKQELTRLLGQRGPGAEAGPA